jgi:hypothetical protein
MSPTALTREARGSIKPFQNLKDTAPVTERLVFIFLIVATLIGIEVVPPKRLVCLGRQIGPAQVTSHHP